MKINIEINEIKSNDRAAGNGQNSKNEIIKELFPLISKKELEFFFDLMFKCETMSIRVTSTTSTSNVNVDYERLDLIYEYLVSETFNNVFWEPRKSTGKYICLDVDQLQSLPALDIPPTCWVRSRSGFHAYYKLTSESLNDEIFNECSRLLGKVFHADMKYINGSFFRLPGSLDIRVGKEAFRLLVCGGTGEEVNVQELYAMAKRLS